jgi:hypothetical protein
MVALKQWRISAYSKTPVFPDLIFRINISVAFKNRSQYLKVGEVVYPNFLNFSKCSERLVITRTDVSLTDLESI